MLPAVSRAPRVETSGASAPPAATAAIFTDVTESVGLRFTTQSGAQGGYHMPEVMGGGAALFDYDGDGDLDVYLIAGGERVPLDGTPLQSFNRLFRHETDGSFLDVTATAGLGDHGYGMGCAVGDIDNDDDLDVYVTNLGPGCALPQRRRAVDSPTSPDCRESSVPRGRRPPRSSTTTATACSICT